MKCDEAIEALIVTVARFHARRLRGVYPNMAREKVRALAMTEVAMKMGARAWRDKKRSRGADPAYGNHVLHMLQRDCGLVVCGPEPVTAELEILHAMDASKETQH